MSEAPLRLIQARNTASPSHLFQQVTRKSAKYGAVNLHRALLIRLPLQHAAVRRLDVGTILIQERSSLPIRMGTRRCPQLPGRASNKPGIGAEQIPQWPSSVSRQVV